MAAIIHQFCFGNLIQIKNAIVSLFILYKH